MLHNDKSMFALLLLRIYLRCCTSEPAYEAQFDHLLLKAELFMSDASKSALSTASSTQIPGLDQKNILSLLALSKLEGFKNCVNACSSQSSLQQFMVIDKPETDVPRIWENDQSLSMLLATALLNFETSAYLFSSNWSCFERVAGDSCSSS